MKKTSTIINCHFNRYITSAFDVVIAHIKSRDRVYVCINDLVGLSEDWVTVPN